MAPLTLSELCALIGEALDDHLDASYWVKAEISSLSARGGHLYLELVDGASAKMRATCWAGTKEMLMAYFLSETGQTLQPGMAVLVEAQIQFHAVYGLSLSIVGIDPRYTLGDIARQRQQTIAQLKADGLLDAQQLLPLPTLIRRIAVISSPQAAGYEDFKHQLDASPYPFETTLFAATMQGDSAARSILAALEEISNTSLPFTGEELCSIGRPVDGRRTTPGLGLPYDCVAIIRGGGATADLSCFDRYELCAVCAQYELPVLTGIGHTRDVSILDLVAHEALKTPTAVAEWLIHRLDEQTNRLADLLVRLTRTAERQILIRRHRIELLEQRLAACNPERIYKMGYSLLTKNGQIIRSVSDLQPGDIVTSHLADGSIKSTING
ncbi:MAG: exodeoxyribonuclease VII large subunit [Paludibacteraceae bacterium]|nr:exodeoxyribonuclease VII large subunit [Paludibacteraceae bacterium]